MGSSENGAGDIQSSAILFGLTLANANLEKYANALAVSIEEGNYNRTFILR